MIVVTKQVIKTNAYFGSTVPQVRQRHFVLSRLKFKVTLYADYRYGREIPYVNAIFLPAWSSNWDYLGFCVITITVTCQVQQVCMAPTPTAVWDVWKASWHAIDYCTHVLKDHGCILFCVWLAGSRISPIQAPWASGISFYICVLTHLFRSCTEY